MRSSRRLAARPGSEDRRPRCPAPSGLRQDHGDRGHKGPSGQGRGKRESARATSPSATLPPRRPPSPARSGTLALCEAAGLPRGYSADAASGCCPATAGPCARAPTPPPSAAAGAPVRAQLQSARQLQSAALRREAPGHSPLPGAGKGAGRGAGAATSQPGIRPSASRQNREPPPPSRLTSGRLGAGGTAPPGECGCSLGPRTRLHGASSEKRERKRRPSQPTEGAALLHFSLPNLLTSNDKYNYWMGRPRGPGRRGITRSQTAGTGWQRVGLLIVPSPLDKKKLGYPRILENINLTEKKKSVLSSKVCFYLQDFLISAQQYI